MQYTATSKYIRTSTRKMRLIADAIRGNFVDKALAKLSVTPKRAVSPLVKVIKSALANAKKTEAEAGGMKIVRLDVSGGPVMKRYHAVSRGMAHSYKKRMTHVTVVLEDKGEK